MHQCLQHILKEFPWEITQNCSFLGSLKYQLFTSGFFCLLVFGKHPVFTNAISLSGTYTVYHSADSSTSAIEISLFYYTLE